MGWMANPRLRLMAGAALISFSPVFVALVSVPATTSAFYRVFIGGVALLLWLAVTRQFTWPRTIVCIWLAIASVAFAADLFFWHKSVLYVGPGLSTLLANFQVFFMTLAGALLLGQKPSVRQLISIPFALLGLAMIVGLDWSALPDDYRWGVVFGLLTAMSYAAYLLSFRHAQTKTTRTGPGGLPARELTIVSLVTAAYLAGVAGMEGTSLAIPTWTDAGWLLGYGVFAHVLGWLLIASSLAQVPAALVGLSLLLQPLLSFLWDVLIFGRRLVGIELLGAAIALTAIYFGSRQPSRRKAVG
ncbi:MAG: DMT family transporter [Pseudomonadota bacterium]